MVKIVITVLGQDRPGIIAGISQKLAQKQVNILDVSQTIMQGMFTMIMSADMGESNIEFIQLKKELMEEGKALGVEINVQREDIFNAMANI
ncbi:ACT domain-containing protein [Xylocopilactobacillus apicola]|uniref:UPF0237 protein XA3_08860 n=1 Tax=Xylocopilactobacillus apicola TaxID=2932184 RepID=A0AAU9D7Z7_9LACO|nr:ACT domain-containing protein [Xylocopilactobacillus apicola]BDR58445.1 hypothetical protein XA3_08860 [Xylocopilactobacillus apicola]